VTLFTDNGSNTTPQQAMTMLEHAWQAGVQMRRVAGDSTDLRDLIARQGLKPGTGTPAQLRLKY
jgi:phosphoribosylcarboxyaminoimidazole (NCAIR) mutase